MQDEPVAESSLPASFLSLPGSSLENPKTAHIMPTESDSPSAPAAKCPFNHGSGAVIRQTSGGGTTNTDWWPNRLKIELLHQHSPKANPMGEEFNYAEEFKTLDYDGLKKDLAALMTD